MRRLILSFFRKTLFNSPDPLFVIKYMYKIKIGAVPSFSPAREPLQAEGNFNS